MYADVITQSMRRTIEETNRRREKQVAYNITNNITPKTIYKSKEDIIESASILDIRGNDRRRDKQYGEKESGVSFAAEEEMQYMSKEQLEKAIEKTKRAMQKASQQMDFMEAARLRDELFKLQGILK
jgi:excinuclease ABC subunit B